jgi:hypothetical protein
MAQPLIQWPTQEALRTVIQELPYTAKYIGNTLLPNRNVYSNNIAWDIKGPATGMIMPHSLNADPKPIEFIKLASKSQPTAFWKESAILNESDFLEIRKAGSFSELMGRELVTTYLQKLNQRIDARIEWLIWNCLFGTVTINENNVIREIDYEIPVGNKVGPPTVPWSTIATAKPLADILTWVAKFDGTGSGNATAYMNKKTAGYLAQNAEIRDLVKQSTNVMSIGVNNISSLVIPLVGDLKDIVIYNEGYINSSGVWTKFIPDNKVIFIGEPAPGEELGNMVFTPSLHNGSIDSPQPGKFLVTEDKTSGVNPIYTICSGFYGIPVLYHPSWVIVATVA